MNTSSILKPVLFGLLVASGLGAGSAMADPLSDIEHNAYVGVGIGGSHFDDPIAGVQAGSNAGLTGNVYGGYQFNKYLAVEGGYADLGHSHDDDAARATAHAVYLDAVGTLPVGGGFSLLGSAGVDHAKFLTTNGNEGGDGLKLGVGAEYALSSKVSLRGEVERYQAHAFGEDPAVNQYTVGLRVGF